MVHEFKLRIKNLGKIIDAEISIKPLTIITGKNSTGKNFVARTLYCILNILSRNHAQIAEHLAHSLRRNFQLQDISQLISSGKSKASIVLQNIGIIEINREQNVVFKADRNSFMKAGELNNIIYLSSPAYLKLKNAVSETKKNNAIPEYVNELFALLDMETTKGNTQSLIEVSKDMESMIGGRLQKNSMGELEFTETGGNTVPIPLLSMGTTGIATIGYLIRNGVISKGSFLIIEEPESYLHPEMQVELLNIFYRIAQNGVSIVMTTHSENIIKAVEVVIRENDTAENLISINRMPYDSQFQKMDVLEQVGQILKELTDPYSNLVWRSL